MNELLEKMSFLGQSNDVEGWMDILILVVVAAVYGLGAILKTAKSKKEEQEKNQRIQGPQKKPAKGGRGLFEQFVMEVKKAAEEAKKATETAQQKTLQKIPPQQAGLQKVAGQVRQISQTQVKAAPAPAAKAPPVKPKISRSIPKVESEFDKFAQFDKGIQGLPAISTKVVGLSGKKKKKKHAETMEAILVDDVLWDYDNPDELKRAIVHYEILGKPLALRNPDESIIGLC
jgi:hypothetical protein